MSAASGFTGKSGLYSQFRPSYPKAGLDYLAEDLGLSGSDLADIGCGTGLLTVPVSAFAGKVYAVDCNGDMLQACRKAPAGAISRFPSGGRKKRPAIGSMRSGGDRGPTLSLFRPRAL